MTKDPKAYAPDDPTFIPDAVRGENPPRFVEIKNYEKTELQPGTNAGSQVKYPIDWRQKNPAGPAPSFELWISNDSNMSQSFRDLLTEALNEDVDVMVNGQPWAP